MRLRTKPVQFIVVHCSAGNPDADVTDIERIHVKENGWDDVGYHYVIPQSGTIQKARPEGYCGAHAKEVNDRSLAICLIGGYKHAVNYTDSQLVSLRELLTMLRKENPDAVVIGHYAVDKAGKTCPNFDVAEWYYQ